MSEMSPEDLDITLPAFPDTSKVDTYYMPPDPSMDPDAPDARDIGHINWSIDKVRTAQFKMARAIKQAERKETAAKFAYERKLARTYLKTKASTEGQRKQIAGILCESEENKWIVASQLAKELNRQYRQLNNEFEALKILSYNVRKEMDVL